MALNKKTRRSRDQEWLWNTEEDDDMRLPLIMADNRAVATRQLRMNAKAKDGVVSCGTRGNEEANRVNLEAGLISLQPAKE